MINFVATLSIIAFAPMAEAQSQRNLGNCSVIVDGKRLSIIGDATANIIGIAGSESGVQVTCDGASDTFTGIEEITVEAGDGDDLINTDNRNGLLSGIAISIYGQDGQDQIAAFTVNILDFIDQNDLYDLYGGVGIDTIQIITSSRPERFDLTSENATSVEIRIANKDSGKVTGNILVSEAEFLSLKMGEGNDQANLFQVSGVAFNILGQGGDDDITLTEVLVPIFPLGPISLVDLGPGHDKFSIIGTSAAEGYEISGVPDQRIPDPEIRVTDLVTGEVTADVQVQQTEEIMIEADGGDDRVEVNWDAALMIGLSLIHADLGKGNDTFVSNLLPVLTEPPTREVQTARFEVDAGRGNDQVIFNHSAGNWFDVFFTVDMGPGIDTANALLQPPPDDDLPGPEGLRQLQFNVVAGESDDFVALQNQTNGDFFDVSLYTDLGGGNDTFEGMGEIHEANILPGRGFDTARVTRNLLPFVSEFERVDILD